MNLGKDVIFLKGVKTWFKRINEYGKSQGILVEHYILSSGLKEIIEGTPIAKEFKKYMLVNFTITKVVMLTGLNKLSILQLKRSLFLEFLKAP